MADNTSIEWTDATWNPVRGCSRVSPGCENCYAERVAARFSGPGQPYEGLAEMRDGVPRWTRQVRLVEEHLADPLRWKRPRRVFVNSMSDLFHEGLSDEQIAAVFGVMAASPAHTFQVLTKRPERMRAWFERVDAKAIAGFGTRAERIMWTLMCARRLGVEGLPTDPHAGGIDWPLPNVWLGVSVEDQRRADERIPLLLDTPAAVRFISAEPLLGPIDLDGSLWERGHIDRDTMEWRPGGALRVPRRPRLDWVIAGAESGPGARPMDEAWVRLLRDQCVAVSVSFFYKQKLDGAKKVPLPVLDGRKWDQFPEVRRG